MSRPLVLRHWDTISHTNNPLYYSLAPAATLHRVLMEPMAMVQALASPLLAIQSPLR